MALFAEFEEDFKGSIPKWGPKQLISLFMNQRHHGRSRLPEEEMILQTKIMHDRGWVAGYRVHLAHAAFANCVLSCY